MSLIDVVVVLLVVGVLLWVLSRAPFIDAMMKQIIFWVVIVVVLLWLLSVAGILGSISSIRIGR